jgi:tetratricopeptide (TPR) repeat protein
LQAARITCEQLVELGDQSPVTRYLAARVELYLCRVLPSEGHADERVAAGKRAIEIFRRLVQRNPESFEDGWQLHLAYEELGNVNVAYERWNQGIDSLQEARNTLRTMATRHAGVASRMAQIQEAIARVDFNLVDAYDSDPVRYASHRLELTREQYEICEKLALLQLPSWNLLVIHARACHDMADYQEEETGAINVDLLFKSERLFARILARSPAYELARFHAAIVRRKLADSLAAKGRKDEAGNWGRQSLTTIRGQPRLCYEVAKEYSQRIAPIGALPSYLSHVQLEALRRQMADDAIAMLCEAVSEGFTDLKTLRVEPAFAPIRSRPEFQAIMADVIFNLRPFAEP